MQRLQVDLGMTALSADLPKDKESIVDLYTKMHLEYLNSRPGVMDEFDCPDCNNRGYSYYANDSGAIIAKECHCMQRRRYHRAMIASGMCNYQALTFKAYQTQEEWQKAAKETAQRYAERPKSNEWLYIGGQTGGGKTHLCTAICTFLVAAGREICYKKWADLFQVMERTKYKDEQDGIMQELREADVLYLDDFLKMPDVATPSQSELLYGFRIIDARYAAGRKTLISTEYYLSDLARFDMATAGRIQEMIAGNLVQIKRDEKNNYRTGER